MTVADTSLNSFPIEDPRDELTKTARKILQAARRLLTERGYSAVTLEKVAAEAGVNKASIRYNFGNKRGLFVALVESVCHEEYVDGMEAQSSSTAENRVRALVQGKLNLMRAQEDYRVLFEILPHALRDEELRQRLWSSISWWHEHNMRLLALEGQGSQDRPELLAGLGLLITAVVDGVSMQVGLAPDGYDPKLPLQTLEVLLAAAMPQLRELAAGAAAPVPAD